MWWTRRRFVRQIDAPRLEQAIASAERQTSGQIIVSFAPFFLGSVDRAAARAFNRLGLSRTREHNGVLFFIVPGRRQFVLLGDEAIHRVVGQPFWDTVVAATTPRFAAGDFTGAILDGIAAVGRVLATHFPFDPATGTNELPDQIDIAPTH
jgi:uncharacterized membrane protein